MPDLGEWLVLLLVMAVAALAIAWPLLGPGPDEPLASDPEREALAVRHRVAVESLHDVEADRRAGLLDDAAYARQRADAEERAARTLAALDASEPPQPATTAPRSLGPAAWIALLLAGLLLVGFAVPRPLGLAQETVTNQPLADALAADAARREEIDRLLGLLEANPRDSATLSALADAYLAGGGAEDLRRAAAALLVLVALDPDDVSAYRRLITAYLTAGAWSDARAAPDALAEVEGDNAADVAFFRGLIALRADGDRVAAIRHFDRFLELAPDDPRAGMIRSLRAEAAGELAD